MAKILLIDDDPALLDVLALAFEDAGHEVLTAPDGLRGLRGAEEQCPALIVSDVNMPGLDGFSLCRRLRERGDQTPLILLTSRESEIDEALGLELGADDYVAKPFSTRVLVARVGALLRREALRATPLDAPEAMAVGALSLDRERLEVRWRGEPIVTTVSEFRLIDALASRPGVVLSRPQLLEKVRGDDSVVVERIIDTYVRRLRRKLESIDEGFDRIETVIGAGYRWRD
jgi:DNA-binding response OmpR family regulator